jgi:predicted DNA-binding WGR domain protein
LSKWFKERPELAKKYKTPASRRKYMNDMGIELLKNKKGEEGVLVSVQEEGTMMVRVGRKMSTSKEKHESHGDQDAQDARAAKLADQLAVKSYREEELVQEEESHSSSDSSGSSSDSDGSSSSGFGLSTQKRKGNNKAQVKAKPAAPTRSQAAPTRSSGTAVSGSSASKPVKESVKEEPKETKATKVLDNAQAALQALGALTFDMIWNPSVGSRERELQAKLHRAANSIVALQDLESPESAKLITALDEQSCRSRLCRACVAT